MNIPSYFLPLLWIFLFDSYLKNILTYFLNIRPTFRLYFEYSYLLSTTSYVKHFLNIPRAIVNILTRKVLLSITLTIPIWCLLLPTLSEYSSCHYQYSAQQSEKSDQKSAVVHYFGYSYLMFITLSEYSSWHYEYFDKQTLLIVNILPTKVLLSILLLSASLGAKWSSYLLPDTLAWACLDAPEYSSL